MDLMAYMQIGDLSKVAEANGIAVSRLRGLRLMANTEPLTDEEWKHVIHEAKITAYELVLEAVPPFAINPSCFASGDYDQRRKGKYLIVKQWDEIITNNDHPEGYTIHHKETVGLRWNLLHGKKRKAAKYYEKHKVRMAKCQYSMWDRYAGRKDVLYIHAKIGSSSWSDTRWWDYENEPWFLEACDDTFDPVYCDIYARIDPQTVEAA